MSSYLQLFFRYSCEKLEATKLGTKMSQMPQQLKSRLMCESEKKYWMDEGSCLLFILNV